MFPRFLKLDNLLKKRSYFIFGPWATGKSFLIRATFPKAKIYDLLHPETFRRLLRQPSLIEEETGSSDLVVIDEIQKLPLLLDEVHRLIEGRKQRFLMTGSSARKIRHGGANLLAGRAFSAELFPLCSREIPDFDLMSYINTTGLPEFYGDNLSSDFIDAYVAMYLKEEIQAESLVRNLPGFCRFLDVMGLTNGEEINYASIASDTGVPVRTLEGYFSILDDTLLGFQVHPFLSTKKRKAITRSKYFLFDIGIVNHLAKRGSIQFGSELFGKAFEHFIALELRAWRSYCNIKIDLQYWRSTSQFEVDFVLGHQAAIEVKGTDHVSDKHLKGLRALKEEGLVERFYVVSMDPEPRQTPDGIKILPWKTFLDELWQGKILLPK